MKDTELTINQEIAKDEILKAVEELDSTDSDDVNKFVMKELFRGSHSDLPFKTDLNYNQIFAITKLKTIDRVFKATTIKNSDKREKYMDSIISYMIDVLMKGLVSKERKGRLEFVKAWLGTVDKDKREDLQKWIGGF